MLLLNMCKVGIAKVADFYTNLKDPFEDFSRSSAFKLPVIPTDKLEQLFFDDLVANFKAVETKDAIVWNYKRNANGVLDLGDQALWHGVTTFMLCLKNRIVPGRNLGDLILKSANGMFLHQLSLFSAHPRLVRGVSDSLGLSYQDNASNDTLTGHLLGIYGLMKYGTGEHYEKGVQLARNIANSLVTNNYCLTNADKSVTTYGKLVNGVLTDALNLSICLAALKLASESYGGMMNDFEEHYRELVKKHKEIIPYGHVTLDSLRHDYDAHRAAIAYSILADLERNHDINRYYVKGLMRSWKRERKSRNPWIYYLMRRIMLMDPTDSVGCVTRLMEMDFETKSNVQTVKNSDDLNVWEQQGIRFFKWGGHLRASQPLPLWSIGSQDFFWQRCQYSVDDWPDTPAGQTFHNGLDFLVAYWGFKELKLIS